VRALRIAGHAHSLAALNHAPSTTAPALNTTSSRAREPHRPAGLSLPPIGRLP
jgi:hypothetical protein